MQNSSLNLYDQKATIQDILVGDEGICNSFVNYLDSIQALEALEFWIEVGNIRLMFVVNCKICSIYNFMLRVMQKGEER